MQTSSSSRQSSWGECQSLTGTVSRERDLRATALSATRCVSAIRDLPSPRYVRAAAEIQFTSCWRKCNRDAWNPVWNKCEQAGDTCGSESLAWRICLGTELRWFVLPLRITVTDHRGTFGSYPLSIYAERFRNVKVVKLIFICFFGVLFKCLNLK